MTLDKDLPVRLQRCLYALGIAMYTVTPALAQTQDVRPGRHATPTLSQEPSMTVAQLAPAPRGAAEDNGARVGSGVQPLRRPGNHR